MKANNTINLDIKYEKFERPARIEAIRSEARANLVPEEEQDDITESNMMAGEETPCEYEYADDGAFLIRSGIDWYNDTEPIADAVQIFGDFWFRYEVCILFADTNTGKSILAVQIADAISRGIPLNGLGMNVAAQPVIYFDFELTDQQFAQRYNDAAHGKYQFSANFYRATPKSGSARQKKFASYEEFISNEIENALLACKAKVIIIDNITCLRFGTQNAVGAQNLMQYLQDIKRRYDASILVLAHTPKRDASRPLSRNDLQGSKMLINFADSAFALGESTKAPNLRYLKQIKQRGASQQHGRTNVCTGILKKTTNFLQFHFTGCTSEAEHLAPLSEQYRKDIQNTIAKLNNQGQSIRQIASQLDLANTTVFRMLKKMGDAATTVCS